MTTELVAGPSKLPSAARLVVHQAVHNVVLQFGFQIFNKYPDNNTETGRTRHECTHATDALICYRLEEELERTCSADVAGHARLEASVRRLSATIFGPYEKWKADVGLHRVRRAGADSPRDTDGAKKNDGHHLYDLALYYLIYGESARFGHLPEVMEWFIFWICRHSNRFEDLCSLPPSHVCSPQWMMDRGDRLPPWWAALGSSLPAIRHTLRNKYKATIERVAAQCSGDERVMELVVQTGGPEGDTRGSPLTVSQFAALSRILKDYMAVAVWRLGAETGEDAAQLAGWMAGDGDLLLTTVLGELVFYGDRGIFLEKVVQPVLLYLTDQVQLMGGAHEEAALQADCNACLLVPGIVHRALQSLHVLPPNSQNVRGMIRILRDPWEALLAIGDVPPESALPSHAVHCARHKEAVRQAYEARIATLTEELDKSVPITGPDQQRAAWQKWARDQEREQTQYKLRCGLRPPPNYLAQWQYTCVAVGWWSQCVFRKTFLGSPMGRQLGAAKVKRCLDERMKVDCKDAAGKTRLHMAASKGHAEVVGLLLGAGAAVDAADKDGETPLHKAAGNGHKEVVGLLLRAGAAADAPDKEGKTPADVCCTAYLANKDYRPLIIADLAAAAARAPQDPGELLIQVALTPTSTLLDDVRKVDSALVEAGVKFAFGVAGSAITANPLGLIQAVTGLLSAAAGAAQAVMYCKTKAARISTRLLALVPALKLLHTALLQHAATAAARQQEHLQTLNDSLLCILKVLLELKQLLHSFRGGSSRARRLTWQFLAARGYQQEFNALDGELQAGVAQLAACMHFFQFAQQAAWKADELQVEKWRAQNDQDWKQDMQHLEAQLLQVAGGMEGLKEMLCSQAAALDRQAVTLQQVVEWMREMQAPSAQLLRMVQDGFSDIKDQLSEVKRFLRAGRRGGATRPGVLIPRSSLFIADGALQAGAAGKYGTVVPAQRDLMTKVAVKLYNYGQLGQRDMAMALAEALVLNRLSHTNVVRCLGIVDDPYTEPSRSIHGSLVMNWVEGGQLYTWLQDHDEDEDGELPLVVRLGVALQVAAGMNHLHVCKVMHGDLKPQNVLLRHRPLALPDCPQVVICDFGLAHTNSTTAAATASTQRRPMEAASTLLYTSPERSLPPQSFAPSFQDDVYAFGILMHFIATSESPFRGIPPTHLTEAIRLGTRPQGLEAWVQRAAPAEREACQRYMNLAHECWQHSPDQRPSFGSLLARLTALCRDAGLAGQ